MNICRHSFLSFSLLILLWSCNSNSENKLTQEQIQLKSILNELLEVNDVNSCSKKISWNTDKFLLQKYNGTKVYASGDEALVFKYRNVVTETSFRIDFLIITDPKSQQAISFFLNTPISSPVGRCFIADLNFHDKP